MERASSTPSAAGAASGPRRKAVPDLALQVLGRAEQRGAAVARQHQPGVGLGEAGQVIEVAVVAKQEVAVAVALALGRGRDDGDAVLAQLRGEARAALGVDLEVVVVVSEVISACSVDSVD
jgi:hypothetical protein